MRSSDLVPVIVPPPMDGLGFRQGEVISFDSATGANTIDVGGTQLADVPMLNSGEAVALKAGHIVALLTWKSSWWVLGRVTLPGSDQFASASVAFGGGNGQTIGFGLSTTMSIIAQGSIDVPSWANEALVLATAQVSVTNETTGQDYMQVKAGINEIAGNLHDNIAPAGALTHAGASAQRLVFNPAASISIEVYSKSVFNPWSSNSNNTASVDAIAVFRSTS